MKARRLLRTPIVSFVDWNSQIHEARDRHKDPTSIDVINLVLRKIEASLNGFPRTQLFEITIRAYCGWHKGYEPTPLRRELASISIDELHTLGKYPNMPLRALEFGDQALGALDIRVAKSTGSHFPATCRDRGNQSYEEKMVDTALVSDLIYLATQDEPNWFIIVGEDVDLMPGVYTAERFLSGSSRKIAYLRKKKDKYLQCDGLDCLAMAES